MRTLKIKGINFPMQDKQELHTRQSITGLTYTDYFKMKTLDPIKDLLWTEKGYNSIKDLAHARATQTGKSLQESLHSTRWMVLFNQPKTYILYTNKLDNYQLGLIKFCITHGIQVALEDNYSNTKRVLQPVCNLFKEDLFKKFKVEAVHIQELPEDIQDQVTKKLGILELARQQYMYDIWSQVNDTLYSINQFYKIDKIEAAEEAYIWYDRYRTQEILYSYGAKISIFDLDKPAVFNKVINFVNSEGIKYGIRIKTEEQLATSDTYKPYHTNRKTITSIKRSLRRDNLQDIINAYIQIKAYREYELEPDQDPNLVMCPHCKRANTLKTAKRNWELYNDPTNYCTYCDTELPDGIEETSYEVMSYKLEQHQD